MRDVTQRVLDNLLGRKEEIGLAHLTAVHHVSVSIFRRRARRAGQEEVSGLPRNIGGKTRTPHHGALPAHPGVGIWATASLPTPQRPHIPSDGFNGQVIVDPTDQTLFEYGQIVRRHVSLEEKLHETVDKAASPWMRARVSRPTSRCRPKGGRQE